MIHRATLLSASLILAGIGPVHAEKLTLPIGEWGHSSSHGLDCSPPFLKIEQGRIVKRLGGGEGRCPIKKIKRHGKVLFVDVKCEYDKSISPEYLFEGDGDDDSFSLETRDSNKILFNNSPHELCPASEGEGK